ncbi:hypothetical protein [Nocardia sp. NPDC051832]|uniref:hypothetical protein n=1 Tax=Nocardia sp. NPDC051832 TaxID=3155673 RepID=UPI00343B4B36
MSRSLERQLLRATASSLATVPVLALFLVVSLLTGLIWVVFLLTNPAEPVSPSSPTTTRNCAPFSCGVGR